jgi:hypothetical protein
VAQRPIDRDTGDILDDARDAEWLAEARADADADDTGEARRLGEVDDEG